MMMWKIYRIPLSRCRRSLNSSDKKRNNNNININFGTNVEHSHNSSRAVNSGDLPEMRPYWKARDRGQDVGFPKGGAKVLYPKEQFLVRPFASKKELKSEAKSGVERQYPSSNKVYVLSGSRPVNSVVPSGNRKGYIEFP